MKRSRRGLCAAMALVWIGSMQPLSLTSHEEIAPCAAAVQETIIDPIAPTAEILEAAASAPAAEPSPSAAVSAETAAPILSEAEATETPSLEDTATPSPEDTATPSPEDTATPSPEDTATPSPEDTATPSPEDMATPSPEETATPSPEATETPFPEDTATPSPEATETPFPEDTATPSPEEIETPSPDETETPSPEDTVTPSPDETETPFPDETTTLSPEPTLNPSVEPSIDPTVEPTVEPSLNPSDEPTLDPNAEPTLDPTLDPEESPLPEEAQEAEDPSLDGEKVKKAPRNRYSGWYGVVPSDEQGMPIPMVFQTDYPEIVCTVRGIDRSVATSGCGATSLSMVIAYLTGNTDQTPYTLFCDAVDRGMYFGTGFSHKTILRFAQEYGVQGEWIGRDKEAILQALQSGKPVIAHMGPGIFTSSGHYVVLRGVTEDGLILLNDPVSPRKCKKAFPIETLLEQSKSEYPFMICWVEPEEELEEETAQPQTIIIEETLLPWGDINASGSVDMNDAQLLYDLIGGAYEDDDQKDALVRRGDLNGDGSADAADLRQLIVYLREGDCAEDSDFAEAGLE